VTTHHDRHLVSETFGETIAELARANQADAIVLGDAVDESATLVVNDPVRLSDLRQCDASWWMSMNDTPELGTSRVRACMDPELAVRCAGAGTTFPSISSTRSSSACAKPGDLRMGRRKRSVPGIRALT